MVETHRLCRGWKKLDDVDDGGKEESVERAFMARIKERQTDLSAPMYDFEYK